MDILYWVLKIPVFEKTCFLKHHLLRRESKSTKREKNRTKSKTWKKKTPHPLASNRGKIKRYDSIHSAKNSSSYHSKAFKKCIKKGNKKCIENAQYILMKSESIKCKTRNRQLCSNAVHLALKSFSHSHETLIMQVYHTWLPKFHQG